MTIEERLRGMGEEELLQLLDEAETLQKTGLVPEHSSLRTLTQHVYSDSYVVQMIAVSLQIYRHFALRSLKH